MKRLVLVGAGHAHLGVFKFLAARKRWPFAITLISPSSQVDYSGMFPGWVAGFYTEQQCQIDLNPLTQRAGIHFIAGHVCSIDRACQQVVLSTGLRVPYDVLSLDIGSELALGSLKLLGEKLIRLRPLEQFRQVWSNTIESLIQAPKSPVVVVGGGAGGVELAFAIKTAIERRQQKHTDSSKLADITVQLVVGPKGLLFGHGAKVRERALYQLKEAGVEVVDGQALGCAGGLMVAGKLLPAKAVLAATGPRAASWLEATGLKLDKRGFILVDKYHRSLSEANVFAAGDVCSRVDVQLEKSGVHAVRAGPVLAQNLVATLSPKARPPAQLQAYRPKSRSLYLLSCANGRAIASWGRFSVSGAWVWRLKDSIDRRFIRSFTAL